MQEALQPGIMQVVIKSVVFMGSIGAIFGSVLAFAAQKFAVKVDPIVEAVRNVLPGANCGACGFAGCQGYAEAVAGDSKVAPNLCAPGKSDVAALIAKITGKDVAEITPMVATVYCRGDECKAARRFRYAGVKDCRAAVIVSGGDKNCRYGCLGYGSCAAACPFGAISMSKDNLPVIDAEKCTACSVCVATCPKQVIALAPSDKKVHIRCCSKDKGVVVKKACELGCIGCGMCSKNCPAKAITVTDNLARIDYAKCTGCETCVTICPQRTIEDLIDPSKEAAPRVKPATKKDSDETPRAKAAVG